jgi:hypothetical protein
VVHLTGTRAGLGGIITAITIVTIIQGAEAAAGGAGQVLRCGHAAACAAAAAAAAAAARERDDAGRWRGTAGAVSLTPMALSRGVAVRVCACGGRRGPQQSQAQGGVHDWLSLRLTNNTSTRRTAVAAAALPRFLPPSSLHLGHPPLVARVP